MAEEEEEEEEEEGARLMCISYYVRQSRPVIRFFGLMRLKGSGPQQVFSRLICLGGADLLAGGR